MKRKRTGLSRRLGALLLGLATLWAAVVTAGSDSAAAAAASLRQSLPLRVLQWELGDLWQADDLSAAAVLTISQAPILLAVRTEVALLWGQEETEVEYETLETVPVTPVEETPLDAEAAEDNGVPAKTLLPGDPGGYTVVGKTFISNATKHTLSVEDLQEPFAAELAGGETGPQVLIIHTHGSEAYTPAEEGVVWSGDHRTTDFRCNVVKVGDVIADVLGAAGISVLHDRTLYDYPNYSGAYDRSLSAMESYLTQYPTIRFVLDIHRDAVEDTEGKQYKVISDVGEGETAAQLTLVVGSDGSGLKHPQWEENLRLAVALQEQLLTDYPTLMRPLLLRNSRYNQHVTTGSLLVEVGAAGNSPEEAQLAARLLAEGLVEILQARSK